ncbi:MAG: hypothetical protein KAU58_01225, partial [Candidatus Omnitrophica bacterium]|nr:hypothetical protein [Candidatus Omnitrophota bacterium]
MEKRIKIIQISLIVACVIFVSSTVFLFIAKQIIKKDRISLQEKFQELLLDKEKIAKIIQELEESKRVIEQKLKNSEEIVIELSLQLNEEKKKNSQFVNK